VASTSGGGGGGGSVSGGGGGVRLTVMIGVAVPGRTSDVVVLTGVRESVGVLKPSLVEMGPLSIAARRGEASTSAS
jgi:hypothetical protein